MLRPPSPRGGAAKTLPEVAGKEKTANLHLRGRSGEGAPYSWGRGSSSDHSNVLGLDEVVLCTTSVICDLPPHEILEFLCVSLVDL